MTKAIKMTFADVLIAALTATKATSAENAKKKSALALQLRSARIADFLETSAVKASDFNDLYLAEKVIKAADVLTRDAHVNDYNVNTFVALKTAILCADAACDLTRSQIRATCNADKISADLEKVTYRRASFNRAISTKRQEDLNIRLLECLNIVSAKDSKEILKLDVESTALATARNKISAMSL